MKKFRNALKTGLAVASLGYFLTAENSSAKPKVPGLERAVAQSEILDSISSEILEIISVKMRQDLSYRLKFIIDTTGDDRWYYNDKEEGPQEVEEYVLKGRDFFVNLLIDSDTRKLKLFVYRGAYNEKTDERAEIYDSSEKGFGLRRGIDSFVISSGERKTNLLDSNPEKANQDYLNILDKVCDYLERTDSKKQIKANKN